MKRSMHQLITTIALSVVYSSGIGQTAPATGNSNITIGKTYEKGQSSGSKDLHISVKNDLDYEIRGIIFFYNTSRIITIKKMQPGEIKSFSLPKSKLKGENIIVLKYADLYDTLKNTDRITYNIRKLEISSDRLSIIQFDSTTLSISRSGFAEMQYLDTLFSKLNFKCYEIFLTGTSTLDELSNDKFIGLKRCKIVIDHLVEKNKFPRNLFLIKDEIASDNKRWIGVHYQIVDRCMESEPVTRELEDQYFEEKDRKKKQ